jgi:hypothetical protein
MNAIAGYFSSICVEVGNPIENLKYCLGNQSPDIGKSEMVSVRANRKKTGLMKKKPV